MKITRTEDGAADVIVPSSPAPWVFDDGGRAAAGFKGDTRDCVTRAIAIAAELPYQEAYDAINAKAKTEARRDGRRSSARGGVFKPTVRSFMESLGWKWTPDHEDRKRL